MKQKIILTISLLLIITLLISGCDNLRQRSITVDGESANTPDAESSNTLDDDHDEAAKIPTQKCADTENERYRLFMASYNEVLYFMKQGGDPTARSKAAYEKYEFFKQCMADNNDPMAQ